MTRPSHPPSSLHAAFPAVLLLAIVLGGPGEVSAAGRGAAPSVPFASGEVLVRFDDGADALQREAALASVAARRVALSGRDARHAPSPRRRGTSAPPLARIVTAMPVAEAVRRLASHPAVAWAEPNFRVRASEVADDPIYLDGQLWGLHGDDRPVPVGPDGTTSEHGSQAEKAWAAGVVGSDDVLVAVIDSGVDVHHPDLAPNMWVNPHDPPNGEDDDGNGFIDDVQGWDFLSGDASVYDGADDHHGTHVAGTIGARGGDGVGAAGVAWRVRILPLKFLGPDGGYVSDAVAAFDYLVDLTERHGLRVVAANCSWGGAGGSRALEEALIRAARADILSVVAAGNEGRDIDESPSYPASYDTRQGTMTEKGTDFDGVISVAAIDAAGQLASFSNHGALGVDLGAPGVRILSTLPEGRHGAYNGTSMAAPHVAGALALLASDDPAAPASELRARLLEGARATGSLVGVTLSGSRLDVSRSLFDTASVAEHVARGTRDALVESAALAFYDEAEPGVLRWSDPESVVGDGRLLFYRHSDPDSSVRVRRSGDTVELAW